MDIAFRTKGNAPINGKEVIFLHATQQDADLRDRVANMILQDEDAYRFVVIYVTDEAFPVDFDSPELARTNLYMPLITPAYLQECPVSFDWEALQSTHGIKVLPIVCDSNLMTSYDKRFSNKHAITLSMQDPAHEIARQLGRMLVDDQLINAIVRDAFTHRLFISYRKKDYAEIDKIMRSVRGTRWGAATSFWFDDFLVPGTDFAEGIDDAMKESDAIVLAVTPNLPLPNDEGKPNYVCAKEYPDARTLKKTIIAVETQPTERASLSAAFGEDFPSPIPVDNKSAMEETFDELGPEEQKVDPYISYLRGMAFLNGIRVERDSSRGLGLLENCSDEGVPEAALQLASLYSQGIGVAVDHNREVQYVQRAYEIVAAWPDSEEKLAWMHRVLLSFDDDPLSISATHEKSDEYFRDFLAVLERYQAGLPKDSELWKKINLWQAEAHIVLGSVEDRSNADIRALGYDYFTEHLNAAHRLLKETDESSVEYERASAMLYSVYSSLNRHQDNLNGAVRNAGFAYQHQKNVTAAEPSYRARWQLATYHTNYVGCLVLQFIENPPDGINVETMSWDAMREEASRKLALEGLSEGAQKLIDAYESLYAEKKNVLIAYELLGTHWNAIRLGFDARTMQARKDEALRRGRQLRDDYPSEESLKSMYREIEALDTSTPLVSSLNGVTPPPPSVMQQLFAYNLICAVICAVIEHSIGGIFAVVETIWLIVGSLQLIAESKSLGRLLAGVVLGFALMYAFTRFVLVMFSLPHIVVLIVYVLIALLSVVL